MLFLDFLTKLFPAGMIYMILAGQVHMGFPPFYRRCKWGLYPDADDRIIKLMMPFLLTMMTALGLFVLTGFRGFLVVVGIIGFLAGLRFRQDLSRNTDGPLPWITSPWPAQPFFALTWSWEWPMFIFDIWTIGITLIFSLLMLL